MDTVPRKFFGGLESLRGCAALWVMAYHMPWSYPLFQWLGVGNGYLMVDLFFVLSGFVICHNYSQEIRDKRGLGRFMFLRLGRLYPLHFVFLLVFLLIECVKSIAEMEYGFVATRGHAFSVNNFPALTANLLMIHPFFRSTNLTFNAPSWSIGLEFYTYLLFGALILMCPARKLQIGFSLATIFLSLAAMSFSYKIGLTEKVPMNFPRCTFGFFAGVLSYRAYERVVSIPGVWGELLAWCAGTVICMFLVFKENPAFDFAVVPMFAGLIIAVAVAPPDGGPAGRFLSSRPLRWLGRISYSVYLSHLLVIILLKREFARLTASIPPGSTENIWLEVLFVMLTAAIVFGVSEVTYIWIEKPGQNRARKLAARWFGEIKGLARSPAGQGA